MAKYIILMNWTDQGMRSVKESPKRLDAAREAAKKLGRAGLTRAAGCMVEILEIEQELKTRFGGP